MGIFNRRSAFAALRRDTWTRINGVKNRGSHDVLFCMCPFLRPPSWAFYNTPVKFELHPNAGKFFIFPSLLSSALPKTFPMRTSRFCLLCTMLSLVLFASGCATPALWGIKSCQPAAEPYLSLTYDSQKSDILVRYNEQQEASKSVQTNAYWLLASADHPAKDSHPPFIKSADTSDLVTIPIIKWGDPLPETGYCARMMPGRQAFDLYHNAVDIGRFPLPCYSVHEPSTTWRVMLTPPAVLADTVIVGGVVGVYASPYILQAYASH